MEPPASAPPPPTAVTNSAATTLQVPPHLPYPDSVDSSPRSRTTDISEGGAGDPLPQVPGGPKLRLMCSYGGQIVPRPQDKSLCYVGGDTRIVVVDRNSPLPELLQRLSRMLLNGRPFSLKYQLPNEDLDSLITVSSEEDLENMIEEYDRLTSGSNPAKPSRIRLFLFPTKLEVAASMGPILDGSNKTDDWFLSALNGTDVLQRGFSEPSNCLLGMQENGGSSNNLDTNSTEGEAQAVVGEARGVGLGGGKGKLGNMSNQDIHSVPDSPILENNSSFGSTSSSPSLANLPPIKVRVDEGARFYDQRFGAEQQFAQMRINVPKQEEGFLKMSSPSTMPPNLPATVVVAAAPTGEYANRPPSEDERSDQGVPVGYYNQVQPQPVLLPSSQPQQKQISGDFPSPDSISSDSSLSNAISRQKQVIYQDPSGQITSGNSRVPATFIDPKMVATDMNPHIPIQPVSDPWYVLPPQYDQRQQQPPISSQQQQQQKTQPQQFIHANNHYVQQHPPGGIPNSYYHPQYSSQQPHHQHQVDQRYPVYYIPAGQQAHPYNLPAQQQQPANYGEATNVVPSSQPQIPTPNPTLIPSTAPYTTTRTPPLPKPEVAQAYMSSATATQVTQQQILQVPPHQQQQQFVGYTQIHHPSQAQSVAPTSGPIPTYAYELANPGHPQVHFTQPMVVPQVAAAQYQTMAAAPKTVMSDAAGVPADSVKPSHR